MTTIELTAREREVLERVGMGMSNKRIARDLGIELPTVRTHLTNVQRKLGRTHGLGMTRVQLALRASAILCGAP